MIGDVGEEERTEGGGTSAAWRGARGAAEMGRNEQWAPLAVGSSVICHPWRLDSVRTVEGSRLRWCGGCGGGAGSVRDAEDAGGVRTGRGHVVAQPWPAKGISGWR